MFRILHTTETQAIDFFIVTNSQIIETGGQIMNVFLRKDFG